MSQSNIMQQHGLAAAPTDGEPAAARPKKRRKRKHRKKKRGNRGAGVSKGGVRNPTSSAYLLKPRGRCKVCKQSSGFSGAPIEGFALLGAVTPGGRVTWRCVAGAHLDAEGIHACVTRRVARNARDACSTLVEVPWDTMHASYASAELRVAVVDALEAIAA